MINFFLNLMCKISLHNYNTNIVLYRGYFLGFKMTCKHCGHIYYTRFGKPNKHLNSF